MTLRDMTPDELELFEAEIVQGRTEEPAREHEGEPSREDPMRDVDPGDEDGLPDGPAKFRVPS